MRRVRPSRTHAHEQGVPAVHGRRRRVARARRAAHRARGPGAGLRGGDQAHFTFQAY